MRKIMLPLVLLIAQSIAAQRIGILNEWGDKSFKNSEAIRLYNARSLAGKTVLNDFEANKIIVTGKRDTVQLGRVLIPGLYQVNIADNREYFFSYSHIDKKPGPDSKINYNTTDWGIRRDVFLQTLDTLSRCVIAIEKDTLKKRLDTLVKSFSIKFKDSASFGLAAVITRNKPVILLCSERDGQAASDSAVNYLREVMDSIVLLFSRENKLLSNQPFIVDPSDERATLNFWLTPSDPTHATDGHFYEKRYSVAAVGEMANYFPEKPDDTKDLIWIGNHKKYFDQLIVVFRIRPKIKEQ